MIYVRIELWPRGDKARAEIHSEMFIRNDGTGGRETGNYTYRINGKKSSHMNSGRITGFRRLSRHAVDLLLLILQDARK